MNWWLFRILVPFVTVGVGALIQPLAIVNYFSPRRFLRDEVSSRGLLVVRLVGLLMLIVILFESLWN